MLELEAAVWSFPEAVPPNLTFDADTGTAGTLPTESCPSFTLLVELERRNLRKGRVVELPGVLSLVCRQAGDDDGLREWDRLQNYANYRLDGASPLIEAVLRLESAAHPEWKEQRLGFPLSLLDHGCAVIRLAVHFTGAVWRLVVNGNVLDEEFPFGEPKWEPDAQAFFAPGAVRRARLFSPALTPRRQTASPRKTLPTVQYFSPSGHNAWVGDVVPYYDDDRKRLHIFYLQDRRHHNSKFIRGGHFFAHLSSTDLRHWQEHPAAVGITRQWQTCGTGTAFQMDGKLCLGYGLHTTRIIPEEQTALPLLNQEIQCRGECRQRTFDELGERLPAGSTYAFSDNGVDFQESGVVLHPCENPGIYNAPDGDGYLMLAGYGSRGVWRSKDLKTWRCEAPEFPPEGWNAPMRNSTECQSYFRWNDFEYVIGGFTGFWYRRIGGGEFKDGGALGADIYEGLSVPMVAEFAGNRRILAGWLNGVDQTMKFCWAGHLVLRELVQAPDGTLGTKWPEEVLPPQGECRCLDSALEASAASFDLPAASFLLEFRASMPLGSRLALDIFADGAEPAGCQLELFPENGRAQWGTVTRPGEWAEPLPSSREVIEGFRDHCEYATLSYDRRLAFFAGDFCIEQLNFLGAGEFRVRLLCQYRPKINGFIVDAEFAEHRTMVTCRSDLGKPKRLQWMLASGAAVHEVNLYPLPD